MAIWKIQKTKAGPASFSARKGGHLGSLEPRCLPGPGERSYPCTKGEAGMRETHGGGGGHLKYYLGGICRRAQSLGCHRERGKRDALSLVKGTGGEHFRGTKPISARRGVSTSNKVLVLVITLWRCLSYLNVARWALGPRVSMLGPRGDKPRSRC